MKQTFLVTGGAGFIGTNLCGKLVSEGHNVLVVDDLCAGKAERLPKEVVFKKIDIRNTEALTEAAEGVDVIVHLAALPRVQTSIEDPVTTHDVNVNGTLSVLEAARAAGVKRVVFAASSSAYGNQETLPLSLELTPQPLSPYALHKLVGEEMLKVWHRVYELETVSLRFFNVYGPHFDPNGPYALVIGKFLDMKKAGRPLTITGDGIQTRDFTHVDDVNEAIIKAATLDTVGAGEVLNIGAGRQVSINEIAELIGGEIEYIAPRLEPKHTLADISKTKELLGWEPKISIEEGVAKLKREFGLSS